MRPSPTRYFNSTSFGSFLKPVKRLRPPFTRSPISTSTSDVLKHAYIDWWVRDYSHKKMDEQVLPYLELPASTFGWLKATRESLFLASTTVAKRLNMNHSTYLRIEMREEKGRITLETLARVAQAMDCELVYAIRPKERVRFSVSIWNKLLPKALEQFPKSSRFPRHRASALSRTAARIMKNPAHRRAHEWNKRVTRSASSLSPTLYGAGRSLPA